MAQKVTVGEVQSNGSLLLGSV